MRNLFSSVNRYASHQTENFLTESLCYVLDILTSNEPDVGEALFQQIVGDVKINPAQFEISTQETTELGRLDVVISQDNDFTFFIESNTIQLLVKIN